MTEQGTGKIFPLEGLRQIGTVEPGFILSPEAAKDVANGKGTKDDTGKIDVTLVDPEFIEGVAQVMMMGAKKYKRGNWQLDLSPIRILGALLRHGYRLLRGEWIDKESGLNHVLHIACNAQFLYYYYRHGKVLETEHNKG